MSHTPSPWLEILNAGPAASADCLEEGGQTELGFDRWRLTEGRSAGVELIRVWAGGTRVLVSPTRGMGLLAAQRDSVVFGWNSPIKGPVHPAWVPTGEPGGLGWLDGFNELVVRCGLASNGAPEHDRQGVLLAPLHGRVANLPADSVRVELDPNSRRIHVHGAVSEARFHFHHWILESTLTLEVGDPWLRIRDRVVNSGGRAASFQLLYHNNFGPPILEQGARIRAAARHVVPRDSVAAAAIDQWDVCGSPTDGFAEQVYFLDLAGDEVGRGEVLLERRDRSVGVSVRVPLETLPWFTVWKNEVAEADGYVVGLEPATNLPNRRSFEESQGRTVSLAGGEAWETELELGLWTGADEVEAAEDRIAACQPASPEIATGPLPDWCGGP